MAPHRAPLTARLHQRASRKQASVKATTVRKSCSLLGKAKDMILDDDLYLQAKAVLNPRRLSRSTEAGSVASALVTDAGNVYTGVCIITGSGMGFCAEHSAIAAMVTKGENRIATIVAVHYDGEYLAPCGRCREFIYQMHPDNSTTRVLLSRGRSSTIAELLPEH